MTELLTEAQSARIDRHIDAVLDRIDLSATTTGPHARHKLRALLRYYAKKPHPWRACYHDNLKRFGPRTAGICSTLKDIIRGTTKWRGHPALDHGAPGLATALADELMFEDGVPVMDEDVALLLEAISEEDLMEIFDV